MKDKKREQPNKILKTWENDNYLKVMQRKVRDAKSTIPGAQGRKPSARPKPAATPYSAPGIRRYRPLSAKPISGTDRGEAGLHPGRPATCGAELRRPKKKKEEVRPEDLDALIASRMEDILTITTPDPSRPSTAAIQERFQQQLDDRIQKLVGGRLVQPAGLQTGAVPGKHSLTATAAVQTPTTHCAGGIASLPRNKPVTLTTRGATQTNVGSDSVSEGVQAGSPLGQEGSSLMHHDTSSSIRLGELRQSVRQLNQLLSCKLQMLSESASGETRDAESRDRRGVDAATTSAAAVGSGTGDSFNMTLGGEGLGALDLLDESIDCKAVDGAETSAERMAETIGHRAIAGASSELDASAMQGSAADMCLMSSLSECGAGSRNMRSRYGDLSGDDSPTCNRQTIGVRRNSHARGSVEDEDEARAFGPPCPQTHWSSARRNLMSEEDLCLTSRRPQSAARGVDHGRPAEVGRAAEDVAPDSSIAASSSNVIASSSNVIASSSSVGSELSSCPSASHVLRDTARPTYTAAEVQRGAEEREAAAGHGEAEEEPSEEEASCEEYEDYDDDFEEDDDDAEGEEEEEDEDETPEMGLMREAEEAVQSLQHLELLVQRETEGADYMRISEARLSVTRSFLESTLRGLQEMPALPQQGNDAINFRVSYMGEAIDQGEYDEEEERRREICKAPIYNTETRARDPNAFKTAIGPGGALLYMPQ
ncbi:hypothetical protein CYMTET_50700 [Cymbomonas tetramitiformis]|uniref:Uncharacterized protein n=1 Tax=Cymbomonas tetramitiformis TaxID=36881 RepID=A0AAE0BNR6_9CHLO|nr:hypothetical protein CYMTET_50700 [Cymbomonas tetramitiformis]